MQILDYFLLFTNIIAVKKTPNNHKKKTKPHTEKQTPFLLICLLIDFHVIQELAMRSLS